MAAGAQGVRAGRAYVEIGPYLDPLQKGLRRAQAQLRAFGASVNALGLSLIRNATLAAAPIAASTVVFARFEQAMARVRALTGATGDQFRRLEDEAKRLGEETVFSASQAANAMGFFALAGYDVETILKAIGPTLNLAAAGQLDIAQAADIATKVMAGMGIEAEGLGHAMDVMTKAMTTANTDLAQLGDAMKFVGPVAKTAGIEFEELLATIQLLSNAGIQAEMAGTTMRGAILSLTSPSAEAKRMLDALRVTISDSAGNVRPFADILGDLERAIGHLGSGQQLDILGRIFPARQTAGMAELLSQGSDRLRQFTEALRGAGGTAKRIADVQLDTLQGRAIILKSAIEGLAIAVGDAVSGPLRVVTEVVSRITSSFTRWVRANAGVVTAASATILAVGGIGLALVGVAIAVKTAAFVLGGLVVAVGALKLALSAVFAIAVALVSPLGVIVGFLGSIAYLSGAAGALVEWLADRFRELYDVAHAAFAAMGEAIRDGDITGAAEVMWASLRVAWLTGTTALSETWINWTNDLAAAFFVLQAEIQKTWIAIVSGVAKSVATVAAQTENMIDGVRGVVTRIGLEISGHLGVGGLTPELAGRLADASDAGVALRRKRRNEGLEQTLDLLGAEEIGTKVGVDTELREALEEIERRRSGELIDANRELAAAQRELKDLIESRQFVGPPTPADLKDEESARSQPRRLQEVIDALEVATTRMDSFASVGTFNAAASQSLLLSSHPMQAIASATAQTAQHTKALLNVAREGGLAFED